MAAAAFDRSVHGLAQRDQFGLALFDQAQAFAHHFASRAIASGIDDTGNEALPAFADRNVHEVAQFAIADGTIIERCRNLHNMCYLRCTAKPKLRLTQ